MENLYSKYRPQIFDDVFGHEKIITELKQRAKDKNFSQCMLFEGNTGTGKTTLEKIISKTILCQHKDRRGNPCNKCDSCKNVMQDRTSNNYYLYNASNMGIDEMRSIEEIASSRILSMNQARVIVIDELQELSSNQKAMKAILKIIEKPSKDTHFVLLTMDGSKVHASIKNRTVPYKLRPHSYEDISRYLYKICQQENVEIDTEEKANVLITIGDNSYGSMRTAVSYLERCIYSNIWTVQEVIEELNIISTDMVGDVVNKILSGDLSAVNNTIDKEMIDRLRFIISTYYRAVNNLELTPYMKMVLPKNLIKVDKETLQKTLQQLFEFMKFPYLTQEIIDFNLINIVTANKKDEEPKRRVRGQ